MRDSSATPPTVPGLGRPDRSDRPTAASLPGHRGPRRCAGRVPPPWAAAPPGRSRDTSVTAGHGDCSQAAANIPTADGGSIIARRAAGEVLTSGVHRSDGKQNPAPWRAHPGGPGRGRAVLAAHRAAARNPRAGGNGRPGRAGAGPGAPHRRRCHDHGVPESHPGREGSGEPSTVLDTVLIISTIFGLAAA